MDVLLLTSSYSGLGLAERLAREGHNVMVHSSAEKPLVKTGENLYSIEHLALPALMKCKFAIVADGDWSEIVDYAKQYNKPLIGYTPLAAHFNRNLPDQYIVKLKFDIPTSEARLYRDLADIYSLLADDRPTRCWISWENRKIYCENVDWLSWAIQKLPPNTKVLQSFDVPTHSIMSLRWFDGLAWVTPPTILFNGVGWATILKRLSDLTYSYDRLGQFLKVIDYHGPVFAEIYQVHNTSRVGEVYLGFKFPETYSFLEGLLEVEDYGSFLHDIAFSSRKDVLFGDDFCVALTSHSRMESNFGAPLTGVCNGNLKHSFLAGVFKQDDLYYASGEFTEIVTVTARGREVEQALSRAYKTADALRFPCCDYPSNIGSHIVPHLNRLNERTQWKAT